MQKASSSSILILFSFITVLLVPASLRGQEPALLGEEELQALDGDSVYGHIRSRNRATLSSEFPAKIEVIPFRDGESFEKGDILIKFDCSLLMAQQDKARAVLDGARKKYASEKRLMTLQSGGQLELDLATAKMAEARAEVKAIQTKLEKCELQAPYTGRVVMQKAGEFEFVQTGQAIIDIIETGHMEIEFIVPSHWIAKLTKGSPFQFKVGETQESYGAKIIRPGGVVDPVSRTVTMIGRFDDIHPELIVGMSGYIQLQDLP
ncbi:efflux RND transporter periplasmic adaptor subunit [Terasakiella sp.]|uniref:efflux RND transporter periplasmic adaptor subunit n=1 Tax=Terasakiella sp. TaxID=2034861 RepID=UPI003AA7EDB5